MNFEQKLKEKLQKQTLENAKSKLKIILESSIINNNRTYGYNNQWTGILTGIEDLIYGYTENYTNLKIEDVIEEIEKFLESVSNENMNNIKRNIQLTEEEERYMLYEEMQYYSNDRISPISEILLRRILTEFLEQFMGIEKAIEMLQKKSEREFKIRNEEYIYELISGGFLKSEEQLQKRLEQKAETWFNDRINCGGFALELDTCIFNYSNDFEKAVSALLKKVPFIRLLGDKKLEEDEYLVIWKVHEGGGHHFVKVQEDGTVIEKDGSDPIKMFSGWSPSLDGCPEAVFAVKKEHEMYLQNDESWSISISDQDGLNFEETVQQAIQMQRNTFEYHAHDYFFKKDDNGNVYICSKGRIIADAFIEEGECLVDIAENEKRYVSNTQPAEPLRIKDGKIQISDDIEK